ncbi:unnamed protein product [Sphagnum balticum]
MASELPAQLTSIESEVQNRFKNLSTGFQKLDRIKDVSKQSKQLDELTAKTREAKRYLCLLHSLHSIMSLWVTEDHSLCTTMAMGDVTWHVAAMSNQELVQTGRKQMDETDQTIERSKKLATDQCLIFLLFLLVASVIAVIVVKVNVWSAGGSFQEQEHISTTTNFWPLLTLVDIAHVVSTVGFSQTVSPAMM